MRTWVEVYNTAGTKLAFIEAMVSANTSSVLDAAGSFDLNCVVEEKVLDFLTAGNEVALFVQEDTETPVQWIRGKIIKLKIGETGDNVSITISGRDLMEELRWVVVGLARSYNAQTVQTILSDLASLVSGWSVQVETASASLVQTARFDGTKVLKAMLKSAEQLGLHLRLGTNLRTLEVGRFGVSATTPLGQTIRAIRPPTSIGRELYSNDAVLLIESISQTGDGDSQVNWAIPMGAGEGTAATTLSNTSFKILNTDNTTYRAGTTPTYPIYRRVNTAGIAEYYIDASGGDTQHQDTLSFKEIGPIANSATAKQLASNALATACMESLKRTRLPVQSYSLTVRKARVDLRPGDLIRVTYKGYIDTTNNAKGTRPQLVYMNIDQDMWVMGVDRNISDGGITTTLKVATIDQNIQDDTDILVEVLDRSQVNNLSIGTYPFWSENTYKDMAIASGFGGARHATFKFQVDTEVTDVTKVQIRFKTEPLFVVNHVSSQILTVGSNIDNYFFLGQGDQHPKGLQLWIDGVNVSASFGGPWNPINTDNTALDVSCDITDLILAADLYTEHTIQFRCTVNGTGGTYNVPGYISPSVNQGEKSSGYIELNIRCRGYTRAF